MKQRLLLIAGTAVVLMLSGCSKTEQAGAPAPAEGGAAPAAGQPATPGSTQPGAPQQSAAKPGQPARTAPAAQAPAKPAPPREFTLASGTPVHVRTTSAISTKTAKAGDVFEATLTEPLVVDNYVVAAKGATVKGHVATSDPGGRVKGVASISVALTSVTDTTGAVIGINTSPIGHQAASTKKKDAMKVGIGAGIGAAIGAIAGGGKGAAIGAGAGGAAGTGTVLATRGDAAVIPAESALTFKLTAPVTVTEKR